ncbi:MAG: hypothetical protein ACREF3_14850 [Acetobacteraceae bacterium]
MGRVRDSAPSTGWWVLGSFATALVLAALVLSIEGVDERGLDLALQATARLSFFLFLPAYLGSPLTAIFGSVFRPLKECGRDFGLAFASAHVVHLSLVGGLCVIGAAPPAASFIFFGTAAVLTYLIALFSVTDPRRMLPLPVWRLLLMLGMNYIMFAFAVDFLREPVITEFRRMVIYLPFQLLSVAALVLRLTGFATKLGGRKVLTPLS